MNWKPITEKPEKEGWILVWLISKDKDMPSWVKDWFSFHQKWRFHEDATHWCDVEPPFMSIGKTK